MGRGLGRRSGVGSGRGERPLPLIELALELQQACTRAFDVLPVASGWGRTSARLTRASSSNRRRSISTSRASSRDHGEDDWRGARPSTVTVGRSAGRNTMTRPSRAPTAAAASPVRKNGPPQRPATFPRLRVPEALVQVETLVGPSKDRLPQVAVIREGGDTEAEGHGHLDQGAGGGCREGAGDQGVTGALREHSRLLAPGARQEHHELITPEPDQDVVAAERVAQDLGNPAEHNVASQVAIGVVDLLEAVQVEDDHGHPVVLGRQLLPPVLEQVRQ